MKGFVYLYSQAGHYFIHFIFIQLTYRPLYSKRNEPLTKRAFIKGIRGNLLLFERNLSPFNEDNTRIIRQRPTSIAVFVHFFF